MESMEFICLERVYLYLCQILFLYRDIVITADLYNSVLYRRAKTSFWAVPVLSPWFVWMEVKAVQLAWPGIQLKKMMAMLETSWPRLNYSWLVGGKCCSIQRVVPLFFHSCTHCAPVVRKKITYASHYAVKFGSVRRAERTTGFPLLATVEQYGKGSPF